MEAANILYTPLDVPPPPEIDIEKFLSWVKRVYPQPEKGDAAKAKSTAEELMPDNYPWDLVFGAYNGKWIDGFNTEFPELADYCLSAFGITTTELLTAVFLPIRASVTGLAFWHNDVDETGFRFYLVNEHSDKNPLLLKKIVEPTSYIPNLKAPIPEDHPALQKEVHVCNFPSDRHAFYINNIRAVHSPMVNVPANRIAGFITIKRHLQPYVKKISEPLLIRSAEKFKDYAIHWSPPSNI
jgi:hypothetical protein